MGQLAQAFADTQWYPREEHANQAMVDPWTLTHVGFGFLFGMVGLSLPSTMAIEVGWELWERWGRANRPELFRDKRQDAILNSVIDVASAGVGWLLAEEVKKRA